MHPIRVVPIRRHSPFLLLILLVIFLALHHFDLPLMMIFAAVAVISLGAP